MDRASKKRELVDTSRGEILVEIDPRYFRPTEVDSLIGDPSKAREKLGWQHRVSFEALVAEMVDADLALARYKSATSDKTFYQSTRV
jgi:GDPmannose 4,6-dehydratase